MNTSVIGFSKPMFKIFSNHFQKIIKMKLKLILLIVGASLFMTTQAQVDTVARNGVNEIKVTVAAVAKDVTGINSKVTEVEKKVTKTTGDSGCDTCAPRPLTTVQKFYILLPVIVFLLVFFFLISWLKRDKFKLSDAIQGDVPIKVEERNPVVTAALLKGENPPVNEPQTISVTQTDKDGNVVHAKSSSRFIALFSGMAAIVLAVCLMSYYVYFAITGIRQPDFDKLIDAVLALGIGVIPYAVNKFTQPAKP